MMRNLLVLIVLLCATAVGVSAQSIRLGGQIPTLSLTTNIDDTLAMYNREYTCLIFAHSESKPCVDALHAFEPIAKSINKQCAIVVITGEDEQDSDAISQRLNIEDYIIAFDDNNRTINEFGIQHIPFVVIYRTKNERIKWFGPINQLDSDVIDQLSN